MHLEVDPLEDVPAALVDELSEVLVLLHESREDRVALMVHVRCGLGNLEKDVPDEVLGPEVVGVESALKLGMSRLRKGVEPKLREVVLEADLPGSDLLLQLVLLVHKEQDGLLDLSLIHI